jgi:hypothetical protein
MQIDNALAVPVKEIPLRITRENNRAGCALLKSIASSPNAT